MIKSNSSTPLPCGNSTTSNCVTWQGDNLTCLGIEKGQTLSESIKLVADEVCTLKDTLDLSDLDLKCIFDICISCPEPEKTLSTVLELLINKVCTLQEALEALDPSSSGIEDPIVRMAACFQFTDADGDSIYELPHSQYTKRIANEVCDIRLRVSSLEDDITSLIGRVDELEEQVNAIENNTPDVSSDCLFTGTKPMEDAFELIDQAFCQLRTAVGLPTDINLAIAQQCDDLNAEFSAAPGWKLNPVNLAQAISNLSIAFCSLRDRVASIESTCCAVSCEDVKVGFSAAINAIGDGVTIRFNGVNGNDIPTGFSDIGSVLTITDNTGNAEQFNVTVENGGEEELIVTGIDLSDGPISLHLEAKLGNGTIVCQKCVEKTLTSGGCAYCEITVTGTGQLVIVYED